MPKLFIADIRNLINQQVTTSLALRQFNIACGKNGRKYLRLTLFDRSGELDGRFFEGFEDSVDFLNPGDVYEITLRLENFNRQDYLRVLKITPCTQYSAGDFLPVSEHSRQDMEHELDQILRRIRNPWLSSLCLELWDDNQWREDFATWPAAKEWHHACVSGLLEHTLAVVRQCMKIAEDYGLDTDILISGAFLHDIGKIEEYCMKGTVIDFSDRGRLLGHIVIGTSRVEEMIRKKSGFPDKTAEALLHMLISHHGKYEWGSPKLPKFREAIVLHLADYLDSQLNGINRLYKNFEGRDWTDFNRFLERYIYIYEKNGEDDSHGNEF